MLLTPEGCFYELMQNYLDLFWECGIETSGRQEESDYLLNGPDFVALFHPALGGLYSIIRQKIRKGRIALGSEWILEIAEVEIVNLDLAGSLLVQADSVTGDKGIYDTMRAGKCTLIDVKIINAGVKHLGVHDVWRRKVERLEAVSIVLHGNGEFFAENVVLSGNWNFEVHDGERLVVSMENGRITSRTEKIDTPTWRWNYSFDASDRIVLKKI